MQLLSAVADPLQEWAASHIAPHAERLDRDPELLLGVWGQYVRAGWHELGSPRRPMRASELLPTLSQASGAFAYLAMQQWLANQSLQVADGDPWPRAGVAFGHLRYPDRPVPVMEDGKVYGRVPWMVGAGAFDYILLGFRYLDGNEGLAWIEAYDRPEFKIGTPMDLVACASTRTAMAECQGLEIPEEGITKIGPLGSYGKREAQSISPLVSVLLGNIAASAAILDESPRRAPRTLRLLQELTVRVERASEQGSPEEFRQLRVEVGAWATKASLLAAMVSGTYAVQEGRAPQRLYREALLFNLVSQDEAAVHAMGEHLLPSPRPNDPS